MSVVEQIEQWAEDRDIINGSDAKTQALKLVSEAGELATHLHADCMDDIGDCMVVLIIISKQYGIENDLNFDELDNGKDNLHITSENYIFLDIMKNVGRLCDNIIKGKDVHIVSQDIGQIIMFLFILSCRKDYSFLECIEHAYNDISKRKGIMYNGTFIKSTDEQYDAAVAEVNDNKS